MKLKLPFDFHILLRHFEERLGTINREKLKAYIYVTLTLFSVSFFGIFAIGPTLNTVSNLNRQYDDNLIIYDALTAKLDNLRSLDAQFETLQASVNSIYGAIPKNPQVPYLTRQIENIAAQNNLQVTRLDMGTVEIYPNIKDDPIYSFLFTVTVIGNRSDANNFISEIINFDRMIGIERITTGTDEERQYNLTFTGRAFFSTK